MPLQTKVRPAQFIAAILFAFCTGLPAANWQATISKEPPGTFPELRPLHASYRFGWSGFTAATGDVHFNKPAGDKFQFDGTGRTIGFVRALWKLDVSHRAIANAQTLHPVETHQTETYRSKKIVTHLTFTNSGVTRSTTEGEGGAAGTTTRQFSLPNLFDLHSGALYLRSQPLNDRSVYRIALFPTTSPSRAPVTVLRRQQTSVHALT